MKELSKLSGLSPVGNQIKRYRVGERLAKTPKSQNFTTAASAHSRLRFTFLLFLLLLISSLSAAPWQTFTNTSHIYDLTFRQDKLLFSTWGGVVEISSPESSTPFNLWQESGNWNSGNGLSTNDIRRIQAVSSTNDLWLGSEYGGINIISDKGIQALTENLGLPSNRVKKILEAENRIFVATFSGLAEYYYLPGVSFPLMLHQYTQQNTSGALLSDEINDMTLTPNRYLWLCSSRGLNYVHLDSLAVDTAWHALSTPSSLGSSPSLESNDNYIAVCTGRSIYRHSIDPYESAWISLIGGMQIKNEVISAFALDSDDALWVAYGAWDEDKMLYHVGIDTLLSKIEANGLDHHYGVREDGLGTQCISRILCKDGFVYLGTWGDGIYRQESSGWKSFKSNGIGFPKVAQIAVDQDLAVWFCNGNYSSAPARKSTMGVSRWKQGKWENFNTTNSPLHSDNILAINVDSRNRKWFGSWDVTSQSPPSWEYGLSIWDEVYNRWTYMSTSGTRFWNNEAGSWGPYVPGLPSLIGNTIPFIGTDLYGNVFVACSGRGFTIFSPNDELIGNLQIPSLNSQVVNYMYHNGRQYFFGSRIDRGLAIWNHDSVPLTGDTEHWVVPPFNELLLSDIYGVVSIDSPYEGLQNWIAASSGLFMWDETYWYKYDTAIKRYRYNTISNAWDRDLLYYVDEERLYGSERTFPTCIFKDPFQRIWIGTLENGLSMYDPAKERFTNYLPANSPLLSPHITALGYEPTQGLLLLGTPDGLNTLEIGKTVKTPSKLKNPKAYPNPFTPGPGKTVQIVNESAKDMPVGTNECKIYDSSGALVISLKENHFFRFEWDGKNKAGNYCADGVYFFVITTKSKELGRGKLVLIR